MTSDGQPYDNEVVLPKVIKLPDGTEIMVHQFEVKAGIIKIQGSFTRQWWEFTGEAAAFILAQLEN